MKIIVASFLFLFLFVSSGRADITERVIYAGDTPLFSDCTVIQTALMELTINPCSYKTTGEARVFGVIESLPARVGMGPLGAAIAQGKAEWMPDGARVRVWLRDKDGVIIERAVSYRLPIAKTLSVVAGSQYMIHLVKAGGTTMDVILALGSDPRPANYVHFLTFRFTVPAGTTDLANVQIKVFTVKDGYLPKKGMFEK